MAATDPCSPSRLLTPALSETLSEKRDTYSAAGPAAGPAAVSLPLL